MRILLVGSGSQAGNICSLFKDVNFRRVGVEDLANVDLSDFEEYVLGVQDRELREKALSRIRGTSLRPKSLVHQTAYFFDETQIGSGAILFANCYVGPGAKVGSNGVVNTGAIIEHDVQLGDDVFVGPGAVVLGRSVVGPKSFLGANSTVLPGVFIHEATTLAAGATLVSSTTQGGQTLFGTPASTMKSRNDL